MFASLIAAAALAAAPSAPVADAIELRLRDHRDRQVAAGGAFSVSVRTRSSRSRVRWVVWTQRNPAACADSPIGRVQFGVRNAPPNTDNEVAVNAPRRRGTFKVCVRLTARTTKNAALRMRAR